MLHNYYGNKFTYNYSIELINPATFETYFCPTYSEHPRSSDLFDFDKSCHKL